MGILYDFFVGVDLGQASDPTAVAVIEEPTWVTSGAAEAAYSTPGWAWPSDSATHQARALQKSVAQRAVKPPLRMGHLERLPLATSYPAIVKHVARLLTTSPLLGDRTVLLIDYTGVGRPVFDMFIEAGLHPIGITITGGNDVHADAAGYSVPKRDLVAAAQTVLQSGRLKVSPALRDARTLQHELISFKIKINLRGHDTYEAWREKDHDDLVLATALACWYREFYSFHYDRAVVGA